MGLRSFARGTREPWRLMMHRKNRLSVSAWPKAHHDFSLLPLASKEPQSVSARSLGEPFWALVFDALAEPIWLMDPDYRIVRCNLAARKLFGDKIIGRH